MPWKSNKQAAWGHSPAGVKALGGTAKVKEWDSATVASKAVRRKSVRGMTLKSLMRAK